jgi:carboxypeptidase family protein
MIAGQIGVCFSAKALNARQHDLDTLSAVCKWEPMKSSSGCFILGFCITTLFPAPMSAQTTSGTIRGVVSDPSGAVVPYVAVVIRNDGIGSTRTVNTNQYGEYVAPVLPSGKYTLRVKATSPEAMKKPGSLRASVRSTASCHFFASSASSTTSCPPLRAT